MTHEGFIATLTFEPFVFQDEQPWEDSNYTSPTTATRDRVRAGAVVRLKSGEIYFVGDCNAILGVCDDCREFKYEDIAEIAYLWEEEPSVAPDTWEDRLRATLAEREEQERVALEPERVEKARPHWKAGQQGIAFGCVCPNVRRIGNIRFGSHVGCGSCGRCLALKKILEQEPV